MKTITQLSKIILLSSLAVAVAHASGKKNNQSEDMNLDADPKTTVEKAEKEDGRPPIGCRDTGYQFNLQTLRLTPGQNGNNQSMYFLFNQSNHPITLFHMRSEESSRSLYLNHTIGPREWGILSTGEKLVKFICSVPNKKSNYGQVVDCSESLRICEYPNVRYGLNNRGNFWLSNSTTKNGAVNAVVHYGIIPGV